MDYAELYWSLASYSFQDALNTSFFLMSLCMHKLRGTDLMHPYSDTIRFCTLYVKASKRELINAYFGRHCCIPKQVMQILSKWSPHSLYFRKVDWYCQAFAGKSYWLSLILGIIAGSLMKFVTLSSNNLISNHILGFLFLLKVQVALKSLCFSCLRGIYQILSFSHNHPRGC